MDGGRVLRAILALKLDETRATHYATLAGRAIAVLMGIYGLLNGYYILAAIAFFIYVSAAQENAVTASRAMVSGVPAESAMVTEFHTLPHGATAQEAAELLLKTSQQEFPVVHGEQVIGVLTRAAILAAMGAEGPTAYIAGYMSREVLAVPPWADLAEVLSQFGPATACALVMEPTAEGAPGRLLGMLTRENVIEFLALRRVESERAQRLAT
jgi:stage IV sporulation protein FB